VARENSSISILGKERWEVYKLRTQLGIVSPDLLASCTSDVTGADIVLSGFFSSTRIFRHHRVEPQLLERVQAALAALRIENLADRARRGDVLGRSQTRADRAGAGASAEDAAFRPSRAIRWTSARKQRLREPCANWRSAGSASCW